MRKYLKFVLGKTIYFFFLFLNQSKLGRFIQNQILENTMSIKKKVRHNGCSLEFFVPNFLNFIRADTFSTKEPETLDWIDSIPEGSIVWDIGANVGLYSCYAAKQRNCMVFAFEPSVFNLELLARNIYLNELVNNITIIPLPLSDKLKSGNMNISSTDWGGALSTFGQSYGHDGKDLDKIFEFRTIGLSMKDAVDKLKIAAPNYIKIDVDGIEHLILKGSIKILSEVKGILVEVNEDFKEQDQNVSKHLIEAGLVLTEKRHSDMFNDNLIFSNTFNQIWLRREK